MPYGGGGSGGGGGSPVPGTGILVSGSTVSIDTSVTVDKTTAQTLTNKTLTNPVVGTQTPSDNSTKAASTAFVSTAVLNALTTLNVKPDVAYAATVALPSNTYANGTSGVGATLTGTANGPLVVDSVTIVTGQVGERILVAGEAAQPNNGWYTITQVGVVAVSPYILTRAPESDQAAEIGAGYITGVVAPNTVTPGVANNGKLYVSVAADPFTVGTTAITFSSVGNVYSPGTGLTLSGSTFSITAPISATIGGTGVNNGSSTITIGGNVAVVGAFTTSLTVTANTAVTLPTTGTLVNSVTAAQIATGILLSM